MKKLFAIAVLMALAMNGFTQQIHFDFAETIESGQTLYFLKGYYGPQDVMVTYPCYHDTIIYNSSGASTHITTFYYGYEEPSGDLIIPSTITHDDTVYTITTIGYNAFWKCTNITSLTLPNTLNSIIQGAFAGCTGISGEVVFPDAVTHLGADAFRTCTSLNSVVFNDSLQTIGSSAFKGCTSLEHISSFPESLTKIYHKAFYGCNHLTSAIVIPPLVTRIYEQAFYGSHISSLYLSEGVTHIERMAFAGCPITSLHMSSSVVSIYSGNQGSFYGCNKLESITVDEANPVFDSRNNCNALIETATNTLLLGGKNTVIPDGVVSIGIYAFYRCYDLKSIIIPNSTQSLQSGAFALCDSLETIVLPSSISSVGDGALNCCGLTSIVSKSPTPPTAYNSQWEYGYNNSFLNVNHDIPIYIPIGTTENYRSAPGWDYFNNFIESEINLEGEWYYEILNDDGSITYQHLEYAADTTIGTERPKIIVRTNTIYDRDAITTEVTHEYVFERNGKVYWWNKDLEEFTTLYDFAAETGDEWEIKVGLESFTMHVDSVWYHEFDGRSYRILHVSDADDLFTGDIVCGIGHLTSFFPERLMNRGKGYRVTGLRCYWVEGNLIFKINRDDCDAIYAELHNGINEDGPSTGSGTFTVYPNPTDGVLTVSVRLPQCDSPTTGQTAYRITNQMGQTLLTGNISAETQQIDISKLTKGMYFISVGRQTVKFVVK